MTIDDLLAAVRMADPQLSPDSRTVVYMRTTTDLKSGRRNADLWAVPAEGGPAKELIGGDKSENTPALVPRRPPSRVHLDARRRRRRSIMADADGSDIRKLTELAMGVQPPLVFSRDGTKVAFVSDVYPECADEACNKRRKEEIEKNPVKVRRLTRLLYRHWDEWRENVRHHVMVADLESQRVVDVTPGDFDSPPGQQEDAAIAFSPDSREIAFVSNREGNDREAWTHQQRCVDRAGDRRHGEEADARRRRRRAAGLLSRRGDDIRARAAARRLRVRPLVPRCLRSHERREADALRDARSVGRRFRAVEGRRVDLVHRRRAGPRASLHGPRRRRHPEANRRGRRDYRAEPGNGFVVFSRSIADLAAGDLPRRRGRRRRKGVDGRNASWLRDVAFTPPESRTVKGAAGRPSSTGWSSRRTSTPRRSIRSCS